jgi:hypothetical protein
MAELKINFRTILSKFEILNEQLWGKFRCKRIDCGKPGIADVFKTLQYIRKSMVQSDRK